MTYQGRQWSCSEISLLTVCHLRSVASKSMLAMGVRLVDREERMKACQLCLIRDTSAHIPGVRAVATFFQYKLTTSLGGSQCLWVYVCVFVCVGSVLK